MVDRVLLGGCKRVLVSLQLQRCSGRFLGHCKAVGKKL